MKKTKIVCTIGPKSESKEMLTKLMQAGMNVMRLNFSHGNHEEHAKRIAILREIKAETGLKAAILLDTKGPEIRTIKLENGKDVKLVSGQKFIITTDKTVVGNNEKVAVTYDNFAADLSIGNIVLIDDGLLEMRVDSIEGNEVKCTVLNNGELGENKGVNLPDVNVSLPALSKKDVSDLKFGCKQGVDFVAASFIRKAEDVKEVRKILTENGGEAIKIISKIENKEGLDNFEEILKYSDGIMVARGDLGVEIPVEEVPFAQKMMIEKCNEAGKPVITATQMLDSMINNPRPTRAEANDVANAILDGTDAVMLSGESAKGKYPVEAVKVMTRIAEKTDPLLYSNVDYERKDRLTITEAVAKGCVDAAEVLNAKLIVVGTGSGRAARSLRKYFPTANIMAITNSQKAFNQLLLTKGVVPYLSGNIKTLKEFMEHAEKAAVGLGLVEQGDIIAATCGEEVFIQGTTNTLKIIEVR